MSKQTTAAQRMPSVQTSLGACARRIASWAALGAAALPGLVQAQATPADTGSEGPLQEITVTATRHEESLSKVPLSITALTQESLDERGVKDFQDVVRFTPGVSIDNGGTNNIAIRGIASSGGAGTTGIYLDDTPIQMRALALNPDEALPKSFDLDRIEVLRGPQGTLFGAGSEGGTVRYITTQPSLTTTSVYSRSEVAYTQGGAPSYEAGVAAGGPIIDGTLGARATVWYRYDGGWIDQSTASPPYTITGTNTNYEHTVLVRLAAVWAPSADWTVTPAVYYQDRYRNNWESYWPVASNPGSDHFVNGDPDQRTFPDTFYLPSLKIQGDFGSFRLISNTSYYHRNDISGYEGTEYNLGFYQAQGTYPVFPLESFIVPYPLLDGTGIHLPAGAANYLSPVSINNGQRNFNQEIRLQSTDPNAKFVWTTGLFFALNKQSYLEQIHDPMLSALSLAVTGSDYGTWFYDQNGAPILETTSGPYAHDSYYLQTSSRDKQLAWFGEGTYSFTDQLKLTGGVRYSKTDFSFNTLTGGPQLFLSPETGSGDKKENSFTPKLSLAYQYDPHNLYYATYAKGFRPGGANNPVPQAACGTDFANFGISAAPATFNSDTVNSFEVGSKNNFDNRVKIATSIYYIKWNNIQQTVLPPICQITFITNLGAAVAKGGDIQADIALTDNFTAEIAAGYTDARYSKDSRLSPAEAQPIVASGDSIVVGQSGGTVQPPVPYTLTIGLEYKFTVYDHQSFVRVDDEYEARAKWIGAGQDPNTQQYDAANYTLAGTNLLSLRTGTNLGSWQVALFVDNLTDSHTVTNYNFSIDTLEGNSRLARNFTFRPRTIGLNFTYRE